MAHALRGCYNRCIAFAQPLRSNNNTAKWRVCSLPYIQPASLRSQHLCRAALMWRCMFKNDSGLNVNFAVSAVYCMSCVYTQLGGSWCLAEGTAAAAAAVHRRPAEHGVCSLAGWSLLGWGSCACGFCCACAVLALLSSVVPDFAFFSSVLPGSICTTHTAFEEQAVLSMLWPLGVWQAGAH